MKTMKGSEILRIAPRNDWMRLDYLERQIKGKILVDEAELREKLADLKPFRDLYHWEERKLLKEILGDKEE